jgi:hypothetical protein
MRNFVRGALCISAAAMLAGCAGSQPLIGAPGLHVSEASLSHHHTFSYSGKEQSFKVPANVTSVQVDIRGAAGTGHRAGYMGDPGRGGRVMATIPVKPGQTLHVFVGGEGSGSTGGFNGGGDAGSGPSGACAEGFGGGGASDLREDGDRLANRILVAGGGGGMGNNLGSGGSDGGGGGGKKGGNGYGGASSGGSGGGGQGGTQTKGGAAGAGGAHHLGHGKSGTSGASGTGGSGGACGYDTYVGDSGSGGGGGYYGGGGGGGGAPLGPGGAGGGGSSYVESSATNVHFVRGWKKATGNGLVVVSW